MKPLLMSIALLLITGTVDLGRADTLVYVHSRDCPACQQFDRQVAGRYDKTSEAEQLPMVKIDLQTWRTGEHPFTTCQTHPITGTPTFIHIAGCREVDRITGYSSDELFWMALQRLSNGAAQR